MARGGAEGRLTRPVADPSLAPALLCVGAATLDTIFRLEELPTKCGKFIPTEALEIAAGMASSAAITAARLGGRVSLCACVGDDRKGTQLIADYEAEGLDCRRVRRVAGARTAFSTILVDRSGDRIIVPRYDPELLADVTWLPLDDVAGFDAVLVDVRWPAAAAVLLSAAARAGLPAILDADVAALEILHRLVPLATHPVFSEPAACSFTGAGTAEAALKTLAASAPSRFAAVTAGAQGCWWYEPETGAINHAAAPEVTVVDTLSAGDVFHGAFALGLAERRPIRNVIERANAAAALKCTKFGGRLGAPSQDILEVFLAARAGAGGQLVMTNDQNVL